MIKSDYDRFDMIIAMEQKNIVNVRRITGGDKLGKISRLMDFSDNPHDISDPWYTRKFSATYDEIKSGCEDLLIYLVNEGLVYG